MAQSLLTSSFVAGGATVAPSIVPAVSRLVQSRCSTNTCRVIAVKAAGGKDEEARQHRGGPQGAGFPQRRALALPAMLALPLVAQPANAVEANDVVETLEKVESFAKSTGEFLVKAYDVTKTTVETVVEVSKPVVEAATPVVKEAAKSAIEAATPVVADTTAKAAKFLEEQGLDLDPVVKATKVATDATSTIVTEAGAYSDKAGKALQGLAPLWAFLQSQSPQFLAAEAGALFLLYLAIPYIFGNIVYSLRGYAGSLTPAQALDNLIKGDWTLVDIRTEEEKEKAGIPALPRGSRNKLIAVPIEEVPDSLRGQLKSARGLECELTAIKIGAHKRLNKGSKVIILDQRGYVAKSVARSLASSYGLRNTYVLEDGMEGSNGWINNSLAVDFYESKAEYLTPGSFLSGTTSRTAETEKGGTTQLANPGPRPGLFSRMRGTLALPSGRAEDEE